MTRDDCIDDDDDDDDDDDGDDDDGVVPYLDWQQQRTLQH